MRTAHVLPLVSVLATACAGPASGSEPLPNGDLARFVEEVQPYLTRDCASGGCHGRAERPYALFAPGQYRRDPARTHLDEPLDAIELDANARRTAAFAIGSRRTTRWWCASRSPFGAAGCGTAVARSGPSPTTKAARR